MRNYFDQQLALLNEEMIRMGALCEDAIALAAKALEENSPALAARVPPIAAALDLLMISKYFERIGDHATNIAEWVIFSVTGVHKSTEIHNG